MFVVLPLDTFRYRGKFSALSIITEIILLLLPPDIGFCNKSLPQAVIPNNNLIRSDIMLHGQILKTDSDFDKAISFNYEVEVTQNGESLGSGRIMLHTSHSVKVSDCYYFKDGCEFTICSMVH